MLQFVFDIVFYQFQTSSSLHLMHQLVQSGV